MKTVLLMILLTPLGLAAQTPASPPNDGGATAAGATAKSEVAPHDAAGHDLAIPAEQKPAAQAATVSTSTSASAFFSPLPEDASASDAVPEANAELQSQVQEALNRDPSLSKCGIIVTASADGIDLAGSAANSRDRLAAWRLAESYARGKKVENHIVVNGQSGAAARPDSTAPGSNPAPASTAASSGGASPGNQNKLQ